MTGRAVTPWGLWIFADINRSMRFFLVVVHITIVEPRYILDWLIGDRHNTLAKFPKPELITPKPNGTSRVADEHRQKCPS